MTAVQSNSHNLVVVGSSAGGIEALSVLVGSLPGDFPAPLVLAQHLDPRRPSHLASILERKSKLPVVTVLEPTPLEPGKVYVVPSNQHVVIQDGSVRLEADHGNRPRPSVDLLLSTAAQNYGDRLFAVILTGSGSDGAAGAIDVKAAGGTVVIQNPATAAHPSMPQALPPTVVDHVEDLERIGPLLTDLLKPPALGDHVVSDDAFGQILQLVGQRSGIDFRQYKPTTILRRIGRRMAIRHLTSLEEYHGYLESHPDEIGDLARSLLIKVTEFFRDSEAFEHLRQEIFPTLIEGGRQRGNVLRLWSAGCATGEEAYSLAFLATDILGAELPEWNVRVFATDLDESAVAFARRGFYPVSAARGLSDEIRRRFFESQDGGLRVAKSLRQMVIFGQQDLSRGVPFPRIDLVLCRNLLIYFKPDLQRDVLDLFAYSLHQTRGFLFLGKAESVRPSKAVFEMVNKKWRIYRCLAGPMAMPGHATGAHIAGGVPHPSRQPENAAELAHRESDLTTVRRLNEVILRFLGVGAILIDAGYRILTINSLARRFLGIRDVGNDQDFLHAVRDLPYGDVRNAIDRVFRERAVVTLPEVALDARAGQPRWVTLSLAPSHLEGSNLDCVLITVIDSTELAVARQRIAAIEREHRQLGEELGTSNRKLSEINKDLQDTNEELQASTEEMMLTQEELQATNEEFEATNEELQATNEELETNNEELQATNEELETTNEELVARSAELQQLAHVLTLERLRLTEMVELAPFHIGVVTGPTMKVESLNVPAGTFGAGLIKGQTLEEVATSELRPLIEGVQEVYRTGRPWSSGELSITSHEHDGESVVRQMQFTVIPNRDTRGSVVGALLYGRDVTDAQQAGEQARLERYRLMIEHAHQVALAMFDAGTGRLLYASPAFASLVAKGTSDPKGKAVHMGSGITGRRWEDLGFLAPEEARAAFDEVVVTREPKRLSRVSLAVPDGPVTIWDCSLIPVLEPNQGSIRVVVVSAVDVTEDVRAHEELQRTDRLKDEFLSLASHELRTPLQPLRVYTEVLNRLLLEDRRGPEWTRQMQEALAKFQLQITHIARLTDDLVDVARLESDRLSIEKKPVDLKALLIRAREQSLASSPTMGVRLQLPAQPAQIIVQGDEGRLLQVIGNLLTNSARHAGGSGQVHVNLSVVPHDDGRRARIDVKDEGPGISAEAMGTLFTRFSKGKSTTQASRSGLGLGLFISRGIVEQHGGSIRAHSKVGKGSTFTVELPLAEVVLEAPLPAKDRQ